MERSPRLSGFRFPDSRHGVPVRGSLQAGGGVCTRQTVGKVHGLQGRAPVAGLPCQGVGPWELWKVEEQQVKAGGRLGWAVHQGCGGGGWRPTAGWIPKPPGMSLLPQSSFPVSDSAPSAKPFLMNALMEAHPLTPGPPSPALWDIQIPGLPRAAFLLCFPFPCQTGAPQVGAVPPSSDWRCCISDLWLQMKKKKSQTGLSKEGNLLAL